MIDIVSIFIAIEVFHPGFPHLFLIILVVHPVLLLAHSLLSLCSLWSSGCPSSLVLSLYFVSLVCLYSLGQAQELQPAFCLLFSCTNLSFSKSWIPASLMSSLSKDLSQPSLVSVIIFFVTTLIVFALFLNMALNKIRTKNIMNNHGPITFLATLMPSLHSHHGLLLQFRGNNHNSRFRLCTPFYIIHIYYQ